MKLNYLSPLVSLLLLADNSAAAKPKNAILLSKVSSLTLRSGAQTTHRRVPALPQLKCISSPSICALHQIDLMRCTNQGSSYSSEDVEWSCTASLPEELKLGSTDVICEGYSSPDDEYVLKGSCGVEYRLVLTEKGQRRYPDLIKPGWLGGEKIDWWGVTVMVLFVAALAFIIWSACISDAPRQARPRRNWGQGWGGGGPGGWGPGWGPGYGNDPPPPYPGKPDQQSQNWQPGFWSGLAGGAAAGYWAGSRGNRREEYDDRRRYGGRDSGWGGWGGGNSAGPSSSSSASSGTRHESTGFGSTRRR